MKSLTRAASLAFVAALFLAGCASPSSQRAFVPTPAESHLVDLMVRRLEVAQEVAWIKFQNNDKIRDPKREAEILASLTSQAQALGIPSQFDFFSAQIRASRHVQGELIHGWKRGKTLPAVAPKDLRRDIRPLLDVINQEMLRELTLVSKSPVNPQLAAYAATTIKARGFSGSVARIAAGPLH